MTHDTNDAEFAAHLRALEESLLEPDAALLTYRIHRHGDPPVRMLRSSVWRRERGAWRMVFHQGTKTAPPSSVA